MEKKTVTLTDVAAAAGVAPMTVSRYLNQHPNVTEKTARKVALAIKKVGYTPNLAARMLMGQPSNTIGLIVPTLADTFFGEVAHSVQETARQRGKLVWVAASNSDSTIESSLLEQMIQHHVDGVILVPTLPRVKDSILSQDVPLVALDRPLEQDCDAVIVDNRGGAAKLVDHLIRCGQRRILCLSKDPSSVYTIGERIAGYEDSMRRNRLKIETREGLGTREALAVAAHAALSSAHPPQAFFCTNNVTTVYLLESLLETGKQLPDDVAVAGFDDFEFASSLRPGITVVRQPAQELGQHAVRRLLDRLSGAHADEGPIKTMLPTTLIVRGSCGAVAAESGRG